MLTKDNYAQICELLDKVRTLNPGERKSFLAQICAATPEILAEVESLLSHDEAATREAFLEGPSPLSLKSLLTAGSSADRLVGARIGPYQVERLLASGGMGNVYLATRVADYEQQVAIKLIKRGAHTEEAMRRFMTERQLLARMQHPNIAHLLDGGTSADGVPYFVMEYIDGESIDRYCDKRHLTTVERARILREVCLAVHFAHEHTVIHRDLKPSNVLVTRDGLPKITDFGLAKRVDSDKGQTQSGSILGTPSYMAPEQAHGSTSNVGPVSDVYALAAILYELLTGRPPFRADTPLETVLQVLSAEPIRPSRLHPNLPRDLETICLKGLEKNPGHRYSSAQALADDLGRFLNGEPIRARPAQLPERVFKWAKRRPTAAALVVVLFFTLVGAFAATILYRRESNAKHAISLVRALRAAEIREVPQLSDELKPYHSFAAPFLREQIAALAPESKERLNLSLALLPIDFDQSDYLVSRLLTADAHELSVIRLALNPFSERYSARLWSKLNDANADRGERLRAACALATFDPENSNWANVQNEVAVTLVSQNPVHVMPWTGLLEPIRKWLIQPLQSLIQDRRDADKAIVAASVLAEYAADSPDVLVSAIRVSDPHQVTALAPKLRRQPGPISLLSDLLEEGGPGLEITPRVGSVPVDPETLEDEVARLHARGALALFLIGETDRVWPLLKHSPDPRLRTYLINKFLPAGAEPRVLVERLEQEKNVSIRRAIILALGEYPNDSLPLSQKERVVDDLFQMFQNDSDPGIHSAAAWLLKKWGHSEALDKSKRELMSKDPDSDRNWYVNRQEQTLTVVPGPVELLMGSNWREWTRQADEPVHQRRIPRSFAIGTHEVTVEEFLQFSPGHPCKNSSFSPDSECPALFVSWYEAAQYCRWLSEQEGIDPDQMCYPPRDEIKPGMKPFPDYLRRTGYRLPTEAEFEYACRAGAVTSRFYGNDLAILPAYGWSSQTSKDRSWPVGSLKPNDLGLFDVHGNVAEWCHERYAPYEQQHKIQSILFYDFDDPGEVDGSPRVVRGQPFSVGDHVTRCAHREMLAPQVNPPNIGLRIARTLSTPGIHVRVEYQNPPHEVRYHVSGDHCPYAVREISGDIEVSGARQGITPGEHPSFTDFAVTPKSKKTSPYSVLVERTDTGEKVLVSGLLFFTDWEMKFYTWEASSYQAPSKDEWNKIMSRPPIEIQHADKMEIRSDWDPPGKNVPKHHALVATTEIDVPAGWYRMWCLTESALRIFLDDKLIVSTWNTTTHFSELKQLQLTGGKHNLRVEYANPGGSSWLFFRLWPVDARPTVH